MRNQEEVEKMFEATKNKLGEIQDSERTANSLQESRESADLSILSGMNEK